MLICYHSSQIFIAIIKLYRFNTKSFSCYWKFLTLNYLEDLNVDLDIVGGSNVNPLYALRQTSVEAGLDKSHNV